MLSVPIPQQNPDPAIVIRRDIRHSLIGYGFQELITYTTTSIEMMKKISTIPFPSELPPIRLVNPISAEREYLQLSLRADLLAAVAYNRKHEDGSIRLFELGKVYIPHPGELPEERDELCGLISGPWTNKSWLAGEDPPDFYTIKGIMEGLLGRLGIEADYKGSSDHGLHSTRQAAILVNDDVIGVIGEVHPKVRENFDIAEEVYLLELDIEKLLPYIAGTRMYKPVYRFPPMVRDIALVTDAGITHRQIMDIIKGYSLVTDVSIFDVYSGEQVAAGKKSLAYRITFQSPDHTLTDKEVNKVEKQILDKLNKELGAVLRS